MYRFKMSKLFSFIRPQRLTRNRAKTIRSSTLSFTLKCAISIVFLNSWVILVSSNSSEFPTTIDPLQLTTIDDANVLLDGEFSVPETSPSPPRPPPPSIKLSIVESGEIVEVVSEEVNGTVVIPLNKYALSDGKDVPSRVLRFTCRATYPVEWIYEGSGAPFDSSTNSFRHVENFSDPSTYTFATFLDLSRNDERNTGKYSCRPYKTNLTDSAFFQVFVPGKRLFLSIQEKSVQLYDDQSQLVIPCKITDLTAQKEIRLYRSFISEYEPVKYPSNYDPTIGFTIDLDKSDPVNNYRGSYICKGSDGRTSETVVVHPPIGTYVRVLPLTNYVKIIPGLRQTFKCEAKENVTLTFSGDRQPRPRSGIDFEMNPLSQYPYMATMEINPTNISIEHTIINCVNENGEVLHTWEYSTYEDVSISKFYFDGHKRYQDARYICCSNSFYKPKFEYVFCKTESECALRKRILSEDAETKEQLIGEYSNRISKFNSSCILFNPYLKYTLPTGLLRCSVNGISKSFHRDYMYYFNPYRVYQAYTDNKFDAEKIHSSESIMKLSKTPSRNVLIGQKQRFLCYYSELFLANGVVWSVEMYNGSKHYYDNSYIDMKTNVSFSQIELTINHTDIKYVHCHAPVLRSTNQWRNTSGWVLMREPPTVRAILQTKDGEIVKELSKPPSKEVILDQSTLNILDNSVCANSTLHTYLTLECNASFPVDFTYTGERSTKFDFQSYRHTGPRIENASEYTYSAKIKFFKIDQQVAGKYSCVSATREFALKGKEENLQSNLHLFVPGDDLFWNPENQTFRAWPYRDSVLIPCPVNDPRINITLLKQNNETKEWEALNEDHEITYDPLQGFSLYKNQTKDKQIFGLYKCRGNHGRDSGFIEVYLPSDTVRVTPYVKELKISANETQSFKCESRENISLVFSDDPKNLLNRSVLYSRNLSSEYPYVAVYETALGELTNLTQINCTTTKNSKTWHTWELYPGDGVFVDRFVYNNATNEMQCCTKPYRSPTIEWTNCSTVSECYMRHSACLLQNKCQPGDYTIEEALDKSNIKNGCLSISVLDKPHGLLKCTVKGTHKIVAQALVYYQNPETDYMIYDGYFLGTKMFDKFAVKHEQVMKLTSDYEGQTLPLGEKVRFDCSGSKFFIAAQIKWALEMKNGTVEYLSGTDLTNYSEVRSRVEIEFDSPEWKILYCIAPNWKEYYSWRNVSVSLDFENQSTTTFLPDALDVDVIPTTEFI